jgi:hypothetical protein
MVAFANARVWDWQFEEGTTWAKKKSQTPSVRARVVEMKRKFSGSLENIFLLCLHFFSLFSFSLFSSIPSSFVVFLLLFYMNLLPFGVWLFFEIDVWDYVVLTRGTMTRDPTTYNPNPGSRTPRGKKIQP